jgi:hypothetical protein
MDAFMGSRHTCLPDLALFYSLHRDIVPVEMSGRSHCLSLAPGLLYMSEGFRGARTFESLDRVLARALIEPCQDAGMPLLIFPMFVRSSRQFIEVF